MQETLQQAHTKSFTSNTLQLIEVSINQSIKYSFIAENIPSDTDAGGIYNKSEANIRVKLIR